MEPVVRILGVCQSLMQTKFTLYDFTLSYWNVMIYGMIVLIAGGLVVKFLSD